MLSQMVVKWLFSMNEMNQSSSSSGLFGLITSVVGAVAGAYSGVDTTSVSTPTTSFGEYTSTGALELHQGGIVGESSVPLRNFPVDAFNNAPRFHSGFLPDEFPAVLQRGEGVIPRSQMKGAAAKTKSKSEGSVTNVTIMALDSQSFVEFAKRNKGVFQGVVTQGLKDNKTRTEWKGLLA
jgi:hypothetical protein